jgi:hypothetical protein
MCMRLVDCILLVTSLESVVAHVFVASSEVFLAGFFWSTISDPRVFAGSRTCR